MLVLIDLTTLCGSIWSSVVSYLAFAKTHSCICMSQGGWNFDLKQIHLSMYQYISVGRFLRFLHTYFVRWPVMLYCKLRLYVSCTYYRKCCVAHLETSYKENKYICCKYGSISNTFTCNYYFLLDRKFDFLYDVVITLVYSALFWFTLYLESCSLQRFNFHCHLKKKKNYPHVLPNLEQYDDDFQWNMKKDTLKNWFCASALLSLTKTIEILK